jgi:hypothetical protein
VRILLRPRVPLIALLLLAPSIPELLTGSTPITNLVVNPIGFAVSFGFDIALYGTGALLVREFSVILRRGWGSVLAWGAAYGIAEEGFAVHTFFERSGPPVGALTAYGSAYGVNWLWALGLTIFHATYSIALPILLTYLAYPSVRTVRWVDRGALTVTAGVYLAVVLFFALLVGHGPTPAALTLFLGIAAALLYLGARLPGETIRPVPGRRRVARKWIGFAGSLEWIAWITTLILSGTARASAWVAAAIIVALNGSALVAVRRWVGSEGLEASEFAFAVGMLVPLFLWDAVVELTVPGILGVAAVFAYLLYRLGRAVEARTAPVTPAQPDARA